MTDRPVLVLGTGRCGSTLLSSMVRDHPEAVSISELFSFITDLGMRIERAFPTGPIGGPDFWSILAEPQPRQSMLLANDRRMPEVLYPCDRGRFSIEDGVPPILQALLPHLDPDDPDRLFDDLAAAIAERGPAPVGDHYRATFEHLADLTGEMVGQRADRRFWVERSGGSLRLAERLLATFDDAKVIHLVRDGRDTAVSMSRHAGFRMALVCSLQAEMLGVDPFDSDDRSEEDDLSEELAAVLPEHFTGAAFDAVDLPPGLCGHYWSGEIVAGLGALAAVPAERLLTVRYEDLVADPESTVATIDTFLTGRVNSRWVERASQRVEVRPPRWTELPPHEQTELTMACRPGFDALAEHGLNWS